MNYKKKIIIAISIGFLSAIIAIICIILVRKNMKLPEGSKFLNQDLSEMNHDEVKKTVDEKINSVFSTKTIKLEIAGKIYSMPAKNIDTHFNSNEVFDVAKKGEKDEIPEVKLDRKKLKKFINELAKKTEKPPSKYSYKIEGDKLIVKAGTCGKILDVEDTITKIEENLKQLNFKAIKVKTNDIESNITKINLEKIKNLVDKSVRNADCKIVDGNRNYTNETIGIELDLGTANKIVSDKTKGEYTVPLKVTHPTTTRQQLDNQLKNPNTPYQLASFTTTFKTNPNDPYSRNRAINVQRMADAINKTVLIKGERFSFAEKERHSQANLMAIVYTNGKKDYGPGGGICQVTSTLHNAALLANMNITQVKCHSRRVSYVAPGLDATYSRGGTNYCFVNSEYNFIKIIAYADDKSVTVRIMGSEKNPYKVQLNSSITSQTKDKMTAIGRQTVFLNEKPIKQRDFHGTYCLS